MNISELFFSNNVWFLNILRYLTLQKIVICTNLNNQINILQNANTIFKSVLVMHKICGFCDRWKLETSTANIKTRPLFELVTKLTLNARRHGRSLKSLICKKDILCVLLRLFFIMHSIVYEKWIVETHHFGFKNIWSNSTGK